MDLNLPGTSSKNQKIIEGEKASSYAQDRISKLPDAILCHILSFLPTKLAAQTGILSKRWKDVWVSVPALDFEMHLWANYKGRRSNFDRFAKHKIKSFTNFVNRLFAIRDNLSIKKFRLICDRNDSGCLSTWLSSARNVEELDLKIWDPVEFPRCLFVSNSLVSLKLNGEVFLNIPSTVSFPRLKILHLDSVKYVNDASAKKLFSSCPILEELKIFRIVKDNVLNFVIVVPSLKRLTLEFMIDEGNQYNEDDSEILEFQLVVDVPNLEYLSLSDCTSDSIQVNYMGCVTESQLSVRKILECDGRTEEQISTYGSNVCRIFKSIPNVKSLTIGDFTMESLGDAPDRRLPLFNNLVHVEITFDGVNGAMLLPTMLEIAPKLESLILPQGITNPVQERFNFEENQIFCYHWKPPESVPECMLFSLKNVEIKRFSGQVEEELKLVKYFLENAMVLEKMTIWWEEWLVSGGPMDNISNPTAHPLDDRFAFRDELMNWTRGSSACQLDIQIPEAPL